jgi:hypothetical protein
MAGIMPFSSDEGHIAGDDDPVMGMQKPSVSFKFTDGPY